MQCAWDFYTLMQYNTTMGLLLQAALRMWAVLALKMSMWLPRPWCCAVHPIQLSRCILTEVLKLLFFLLPLQCQDSPLWKWWARFSGLFLGDIPPGPSGIVVGGGWRLGGDSLLWWQKAESALQLQDLEAQQNDVRQLHYLCWQCKKKLALVWHPPEFSLLNSLGSCHFRATRHLPGATVVHGRSCCCHSCHCCQPWPCSAPAGWL